MNHQIVNHAFDARHAGDVSVEAAETYIRAAMRRMESDRAAGMASLDDIFRSGRPPHALDGRYRGELLAVDIAPGVTQYVGFIQRRFHPWLGKSFDNRGARGINVFGNTARPWFRFLMPPYNGYRPDSVAAFRAFDFRTYVAPARMAPDVLALKIDYDIPGNPRPTIRRVLDELVEVADGYYLGRAFVHWWWGRWQRVAYFSLQMDRN
jgi:hypothetical protein